MATDFRKGSDRRRGVAMFFVLAVIVVVTMLGFLGLSMADKDAAGAGANINARTQENAAYSGLSLALDRMAQDGGLTASQLQAFISDSSAAAGSVHQWFDFTQLPFRLVTAPPTDPYPIAVGGTTNASVRVRILSMDIGTASGAPSDGIKITLESSGAGRSGDPLTTVATYRLLGIDVGMSIHVPTNSTPANAFNLRGSVNASNIGQDINGSVYVGGDFMVNASAPWAVHGRFRVAGDVSLDGNITVDSNTFIGGSLMINSATVQFRKNLVISNGFKAGMLQGTLQVDSNLTVYGDGTNNFDNYTGRLIVGGQLNIPDATLKIPEGGVSVGQNAYVASTWCGNNASRLEVQGNLEITGAGSALPTNVLCSLYVAGSMGVRNATGSTRYKNSYRHRVLGGLYQLGPMDIDGSGRIMVGGTAGLDGGISAFGSGTDTHSVGNLWVKGSNQKTENKRFRVDGDLVMKGTLYNFPPWSQHFGKFYRWHRATPGGTFVMTRAFGPDTASAGINLDSITKKFATRITRSTDTSLVFSSAIDAFVGPRSLSTIGYTQNDTLVKPADNERDSIRFTADQSPAIFSKQLVYKNSLCSLALGTSCPTQPYGKTFNRLHAWADSLGYTFNGYLVLVFNDSAIIPSQLKDDTTKFKGKMLFVWDIDTKLSVNGDWPASADSNAIQVVYFKQGAPENFGSQGDIYGYIHLENGSMSTSEWSTGGSKIHGALYVGGTGGYTGNTGKLNLDLDPRVFTDLNTNLPNLLKFGGAQGSSSPPIIRSTRTLVFRQSGVQFVPLGEYR